MIAVLLLALLVVGHAVAQDPQEPRDPLSRKVEITLADLQGSLEDPQLRDHVIERHFARAELTEDQQRRFLNAALQHASWQVRQQSIAQLVRLEMLKATVLVWVLAAGSTATSAFEAAAATELQPQAPPEVTNDEAYIRSLIRDLGADSTVQRFAAASQLSALGDFAIPGLLDALADPQLATEAAAALGRLFAAVDEEGPSPEPGGRGVSSASTPSAGGRVGQALVREVDGDHPKEVRVYFGTNRQLLEGPPSPARYFLTGGGVLALLGLLQVRRVRRARKRAENAIRRSVGFGTVCLWGISIVAGFWAFFQVDTGWREYNSQQEGERFGGRRASDNQVRYGHCDVSIPPTHSVGEVERPTLGAEDEQKHVLVRRTDLLADEAFFDAVRERLTREDVDGECFVFVHGYNVSFDSAARRTAQIHYDLEFSGVPMFFSWPSRGNFRHYFADRNEILISRGAIKQFLANVVNRTGARRVHVIAHSMGADAVCQAIADLDVEGRVFEQVILAAPDIDADVFQNQLLPKMKPRARRTTLYCSRNDWALFASTQFNDSRRAGDSSLGLVVSEGLDTIDASDMDTELLGHSYFGSCMPMIKDLRQVLTTNKPPLDRDLEQQPSDPRPFWTFRQQPQ